MPSIHNGPVKYGLGGRLLNPLHLPPKQGGAGVFCIGFLITADQVAKVLLVFAVMTRRSVMNTNLPTHWSQLLRPGNVPDPREVFSTGLKCMLLKASYIN